MIDKEININERSLYEQIIYLKRSFIFLIFSISKIKLHCLPSSLSPFSFLYLVSLKEKKEKESWRKKKKKLKEREKKKEKKGKKKQKKKK